MKEEDCLVNFFSFKLLVAARFLAEPDKTLLFLVEWSLASIIEAEIF
jgi:hypothetical protein